MAGTSTNWIKMRKILRDDGRVMEIANKCRIAVERVLGCLYVFWSIADDQVAGEDGLLRGYTAQQMDRTVHVRGFTKALPKDWVEIRPDGLYLPNYQEHNGSTAKARAVDQKRKRAGRNPPPPKPKPEPTPDRTRTELGQESPTIDIDIEGEGDSKPENAPKTAHSLPASRKPRKPNPLWDAIAAQFFFEGVPKGDRKRVGKIVRDLKDMGATPDDIAIRSARYVKHWPDTDLTPEALVKHWSHFAEDRGAPKSAGGTRTRSGEYDEPPVDFTIR